MGRTPCCQKEGLKKGPWTVEEDQKLLAYIEENDHGSWRALPAKAGLQRCGKSCRLRWMNYLRPDIKRGSFSLEEEETIIQFHALLGNRWSAIATHLPKRTDNEIKNYWNTHLKKHLTKMDSESVTHKPKTRSPRASVHDPMGQSKDARVQAQDQTAREPHHQQHQPLTITTSTSASARLLNIVATRPAARSLCLDVLRAWQGIKSESTTIGSSASPGSSESESSSCTSSELIRNSSSNFNGIWKENDGDEYWNGYDKSLTDLLIDDEWTFESVKTGINQEPDLNFVHGFTEILLSHFDDQDS